jgi:hypothetical protein
MKVPIFSLREEKAGVSAFLSPEQEIMDDRIDPSRLHVRVGIEIEALVEKGRIADLLIESAPDRQFGQGKSSAPAQRLEAPRH